MAWVWHLRSVYTASNALARIYLTTQIGSIYVFVAGYKMQMELSI